MAYLDLKEHCGTLCPQNPCFLEEAAPDLAALTAQANAPDGHNTCVNYRKHGIHECAMAKVHACTMDIIHACTIVMYLESNGLGGHRPPTTRDDICPH